MAVSVTFDSNVWEVLVDEEKRLSSDPVYSRLFGFVERKIVRPYFFEGIVIFEGVKKVDRKSYFADYKGGFSMSVDGEEIYSQEGTQSLKPSEYLSKTIPVALSLGFRFTRLPRIGAPSMNIPGEYFAPDEKFSMAERQSRSFECAKFIQDLGAGKGMLLDKLPGVPGGVVQKTKADSSISDKKYAGLVGEWADGDALAASYGYGIDYFCTNDGASGAGTSSIFHPDNLSQLEQKYPVNVVSPSKLVELIEGLTQ